MMCKDLLDLTADAFSALDLQLYIDTHPENTDAIAVYNETVRALQKKQAEYIKSHGPLFSFIDVSDEKRFNWIDSPWPWENEEM